MKKQKKKGKRKNKKQVFLFLSGMIYDEDGIIMEYGVWSMVYNSMIRIICFHF